MLIIVSSVFALKGLFCVLFFLTLVSAMPPPLLPLSVTSGVFHKDLKGQKQICVYIECVSEEQGERMTAAPISHERLYVLSCEM